MMLKKYNSMNLNLKYCVKVLLKENAQSIKE